MQYLLTEHEFNELHEAINRHVVEHTNMVQDLCIQVAEHRPIKNPWNTTKPEHPWGCVITGSQVHCDHCPVQEQCPNPRKSYSK